MNRIEIERPEVNGNIVTYHYSVTGEWSELFTEREPFYIEYSVSINDVPEGVLMVPFIANILPVSWIYNAEIHCSVCDKDFFDCIADIKRGYANMFPMMEFRGVLKVDVLQKNKPAGQDGCIVFFSGGVDSFYTLISHRLESPTLFTVCGSDITLDDLEGWENVKRQTRDVATVFNTPIAFSRSPMRTFMEEGMLYEKVVHISGDGWWHGFQHGIGIISHAAPLMYALNKKTVYFASSFTPADKGKYTCASDPTIDNFVHFCGADVVHDGYEYNRVEKIRTITHFSEETRTQIQLRVCWASTGGSNCCHCEKCWRTILGIYASGSDPRRFGFEYDSFSSIAREIKANRIQLGENKDSRYGPVWYALRKNYTLKTVDPSLRWFYKSDFSELETGNVYERGLRKAKRWSADYYRKIKRRLRRFLFRQH